MESTRKIENDLKCEICEKTFQNNQRKKHHFKTAHGEIKNFSCDVSMHQNILDKEWIDVSSEKLSSGRPK